MASSAYTLSCRNIKLLVTLNNPCPFLPFCVFKSPGFLRSTLCNIIYLLILNWAAIRNRYTSGDLNEYICLTVLEDGSPRTRSWHIQYEVGILVPFADSWFFATASHGEEREETSPQASSSNVPISLWQVHNLDLTYP